MQIKLDAQGYIEGWVSVGGIDGGRETSLSENELNIPHLTAYKLTDGVLVKDEEKYAELVAS